MGSGSEEIKGTLGVNFDELDSQLKQIDQERGVVDSRVRQSSARIQQARSQLSRLELDEGRITKRIGKLIAKQVAGEFISGVINEKIDQSNISTGGKEFSKAGVSVAETAFTSGGNPIAILARVVTELFQIQKNFETQVKAVQEKQQAFQDRQEERFRQVGREARERDDKLREEIKKAKENAILKGEEAAYQAWILTGE
jgi:hypothetical protein